MYKYEYVVKKMEQNWVRKETGKFSRNFIQIQFNKNNDPFIKLMNFLHTLLYVPWWND